MRKGLTAALVLCLVAGCVLFALGRRTASETAWKARAETAEQRVNVLEQALEDVEARRQVPDGDPIALFFASFPYSGGTAGYLAYMETDLGRVAN